MVNAHPNDGTRLPMEWVWLPTCFSQQHDSVDGSVGWWSRQKKNKSLDRLDVTCSHLSAMQLTFYNV